MTYDKNPFTDQCSDREAIWDMLVYRDIDAYLAADWTLTAPDFREDGFFGIDACKDPNPDNWKMAFFSLPPYRDEWLRQAAETQETADLENAREALFNATDMTDIEISGDTALVRKKFDGNMPLRNGGADRLNWQTLYICQRVGGDWKIASFVGYMKHKDD